MHRTIAAPWRVSHAGSLALFIVALLVVGSDAWAQACPLIGGFQAGSIAQTFRWKPYGSGTLQTLPKGPLPSGFGINVYVDGIGVVAGSCDDYDWNGSSCYLARTTLNTINSLAASGRGLATRRASSICQSSTPPPHRTSSTWTRATMRIRGPVP